MFMPISARPLFESFAKLFASVVLGLCLSAAGAASQQRQNLEVTPDGRGGATGQYGGQNFQVERDYSRPQNRAGSRQHNPVIVIPPSPDRQTGKTKSRCYADGRGNTVCY